MLLASWIQSLVSLPWVAWELILERMLLASWIQSLVSLPWVAWELMPMWKLLTLRLPWAMMPELHLVVVVELQLLQREVELRLHLVVLKLHLVVLVELQLMQREGPLLLPLQAARAWRPLAVMVIGCAGLHPVQAARTWMPPVELVAVQAAQAWRPPVEALLHPDLEVAAAAQST